MKGVWSMKLPVVLILLLLFLGCSPCLAGEVLKEDFEVNYNLAFAGDSEGDGGYFLYRFSYFAPFFLDSPGIAFQYEAGYKHTSIGLKKWDLLDYRLGLGFNCIFSYKNHRNSAGYFLSYSPRCEPYASRYSGYELFIESLLAGHALCGFTYGKRSYYFSPHAGTPAGYRLPLDNTVQSYAVKYESCRRLGGKSNEAAVAGRILLCYAHAGKAGAFGDGEAQFAKIFFARARMDFNRVYARDKHLRLFGGVDYAREGDLATGNELLVLGESYNELYGFPGNSIKYRLGFLAGVAWGVQNLFDRDFALYLYDSLFFCDEPGAHYQFSRFYNGLGVGCMIPVTIPVLGRYELRFDYMLASAGFTAIINRQYAVNLYTTIKW